MDVLGEYQRLKRAAAEADAAVIRGEAMVDQAEQEAKLAAKVAQDEGFTSLEEVVAARDALMAEAEAAVTKVLEVLG